MKWVLVIFAAIFLTGCGAHETSKNVMCETAACDVFPYTITIGVPNDASEVTSKGGAKVYRHEGGEYEIRTMVYSAPNAEKAIRHLTEENAKNLCVTQHTRFSMPEYRLKWYDAKEAEACYADIVIDAQTCYAVFFSADEKVAEKYIPLITEVFSTFGLFYDEGV